MLRKYKNLIQSTQKYSIILNSYSSFNDEATNRIKKEIEESKKNMKWRVEAGERPQDWNTKFKLFGDSEQNSDFISIMQQPINLSPRAIKKWWIKRQERIERHMQSFICERNEILGSDLAAAHFIVHRGGAVRFVGNSKWIKANDDGEYDLPKKYQADYKVEAIRCDNMKLYYEGLENLRCLQSLKFVSFHNVKTFDDWCLDRISGAENPKLSILDISGTNITYRGLAALYRLDNLNLLIVDDLKYSKEFELSCAMLEATNPNLKISSVKEIDNL